MNKQGFVIKVNNIQGDKRNPVMFGNEAWVN